MKRHMRRLGRFTAACVMAVASPASALILELSPEHVQEALEMGARGIAQADFGEEWRVLLPGGEEIVVTTPFSRLARAAHQAALRGDQLTSSDREVQLDRGRGRLQLLVTMYGPAPDFARWYRPMLEVGGRAVKPTFTQNERTGLRFPDGQFAARNLYVFSLEGLPPQGTVTLVVRSAVDQAEILRAPIDLSTMR